MRGAYRTLEPDGPSQFQLSFHHALWVLQTGQKEHQGNEHQEIQDTDDREQFTDPRDWPSPVALGKSEGHNY